MGSVYPPPGSHILIIGAGITGLLFAQSLRKRRALDPSLPNPNFSIYERDPTPSFRGPGWGLTIHWALSDLLSLLPQHLIDRIPETYVDFDAVDKGETGNFLLYDLQTGAEKCRVPPNKRIRVSRERLRRLLTEGLDINWSKKLIAIESPDESTITAKFEDGTTTTGTLLIGADGSRSQVRKITSSSYRNNRLPVRLLGVSVPYSKTRCQEIRALDPYFFQACDPATDAFLWFSFLNVPASSMEGTPEDRCICQILTSWPYRDGFRGNAAPIEVPESNEARVKWMKDLARGWTEPFSSIVQDIPAETEVKTIALEDWIPRKGLWDNHTGRIALVGDAAHAMTMFRGEAANHGIADIASLYRELFENDNSETSPIERYEDEMIPRAQTAVLNSRRACMDAHDSKNITEASPLVARRAIVLED